MQPTHELMVPAAEQLPMPSPNRLRLNGLLFAIAFGVVESCLASVTYFSSAFIDRSTAMTSNALLFLGFTAGTIVAPTAVAQLGSKRSLVVGMSLIVLYVLAFTYPEPWLVHPVGLLVGGFGAVMWTAQGTTAAPTP